MPIAAYTPIPATSGRPTRSASHQNALPSIAPTNTAGPNTPPAKPLPRAIATTRSLAASSVATTAIVRSPASASAVPSSPMPSTSGTCVATSPISAPPERRLQPARHARDAPAALDDLHAADQRPRGDGTGDAEQREQRQLAHDVDVVRGNVEERRSTDGELAHDHREHDGDDDRGEHPEGVVPDDDLEGEDDGGDRRVERHGNGGRCAAAEQRERLLVIERETLGEPGGQRRADVHRRPLAPERRTDAEGDARRERRAEAGLDRHARAVERAGLHDVGDAVIAPARHEVQERPHDEPPERRDQDDPPGR